MVLQCVAVKVNFDLSERTTGITVSDCVVSICNENYKTPKNKIKNTPNGGTFTENRGSYLIFIDSLIAWRGCNLGLKKRVWNKLN